MMVGERMGLGQICCLDKGELTIMKSHEDNDYSSIKDSTKVGHSLQ